MDAGTPCEVVEGLNGWQFNCAHYLPKRPFIIRRGATSWLRINELALDRLRERFADRKIVIAHSARRVFDYNNEGSVERREMTFGEAVDLVRSPDGGQYYILQQSVSKHFPELRAAVSRPPLLPPTKLAADPNLWIGGDGCKTPLHFDYADNFFVQVNGRKRISLIAPKWSEALYPAIGLNAPHCSRVDVFAPDLDKFPRYIEARANTFYADLADGDMLYIPTGWWHAVQAFTPSVSVNFWWLRASMLIRTNARALRDRLASMVPKPS